MKGYYIKETREWWDYRYKGVTEIKYHGNLRVSTQKIYKSKDVEGINLFTSVERALVVMGNLQREAHAGNFKSTWEILCEDIQ